MKAAVLRKPYNIIIQDVPMPKINRDEVLIKIGACSICGSDIHAYHGLGDDQVTYPTILGHEIAGVVAEIGEEVEGVKMGERVSADDDLTCGKCRWCLSGRPNLCADRHTLGARFDGGYAEYVKVPAKNLHRIPENVPFEHACVGQTLGIGYHGVVDRGNVQPGEFVVVIGAGPVGLSALAVSKVFEAKVLITDVVPYRLEAAKKMGADYVVDSSKEDLVKEVMNLTKNEGADKVFECVGGRAHETTLRQAVDVVRAAGRIVNFGAVSEPYMQINLGKISRWEIEFTSTRGVVHRIGATLNLMGEGKINVEPMVTHVLPLEDVKRGIELMDKKLEKAVKVALKP